MGTVEYETRRNFERRIGRRVEVDAIDVTWIVAQTGRFGMKKRPLVAAGQIEDISVTGAAVIGPAELPLEPGATTLLRSGGGDSVVVVRHRAPTEDHGIVRYGVEITRPSPSLKQHIHQVLTQAAGGSPGSASSVEPGPTTVTTDAPSVTPAQPLLDLTADEPVIDLTDD